MQKSMWTNQNIYSVSTLFDYCSLLTYTIFVTNNVNFGHK